MQFPRPALLSLLAFTVVLGAAAQSDTVSVRVRHGNACDVVVTLAEMKQLTQHTATIAAHDGEQATYEGVLLKKVLGLHCTSLDTLGKRMMVQSAVRVGASDGYSALVALTEADSSFREQPVLLVWLRNGQPLSDHDGPLQLIVPDDKRHARDVRKVSSLEVITP
ncbi:MAG TPA: molybdopterin-dependent oxidoreductase [Flavobacteriales bacterium]|nr:molybdopterin-dependent oxidoreductase [Flavobacteriales bacterium]